MSVIVVGALFVCAVWFFANPWQALRVVVVLLGCAIGLYLLGAQVGPLRTPPASQTARN